MTPEGQRERQLVLIRDGVCFLYRLDKSHVCRDAFGNRHAATDIHRMTVDHFHLHAGGTLGKKADDDCRHMVAMCAAGNIACPSAEVRQAERDYIRHLYEHPEENAS
jgi:hypothetical protein